MFLCVASSLCAQEKIFRTEELGCWFIKTRNREGYWLGCHTHIKKSSDERKKMVVRSIIQSWQRNCNDIDI